ncbi:phosphonate transporter [Pseudomonas frederiksbergensis]|uniref:Phosphonate transporter n=1 Tax=Pseudomonas frederiksbergensis TaxID=104087 RepID=A0A423KR20_9PSED|nr:phosphonate transporter [Pseudomonas frederiksbergensis]RON57793.1 phosphonate transporter [Pseudomonas frederiksbergensis]
MNLKFEETSIQALLDAPDKLDTLNYGIIGFNDASEVVIYNTLEASRAGLRQARVLGKNLFLEIAPCMNNAMVAQRFENEPELDVIISYVLALRMRPIPVRLRLLKKTNNNTRFLLVEWA